VAMAERTPVVEVAEAIIKTAPSKEGMVALESLPLHMH